MRMGVVIVKRCCPVEHRLAFIPYSFGTSSAGPIFSACSRVSKSELGFHPRPFERLNSLSSSHVAKFKESEMLHS
ncbi:hypothetical protein M427DRAFT_114302, partial [Gonapodya prolifera JEL478]